MTRINVGVLNAGEGRNVIPATAQLQLEVRGENKAINEYMVAQVMQMAKGSRSALMLAMKRKSWEKPSIW